MELTPEYNRNVQASWYRRHKNKHGSIYQFTCIPTGERFIGSTTINPKKRLWQLSTKAKGGATGLLYDRLREYGSNQFSVETLYACTSISNHKQLRDEYIREYKPELNEK